MTTLHLVPEDLRQLYHVREWRNATGVLQTACPQEWQDIIAVLRAFRLLRSAVETAGGSKSPIANQIDAAFYGRGWVEKQFRTAIMIDDTIRESPTHKVDCFKGRVAVELEWNNKDPFFDRDLENFKRLHADGAISVGIIVTRGRSLHQNMRDLVGRFADERQIRDLSELERWGYSPTRRQRAAIEQRMTRSTAANPLRDAFVSVFVADKFGEATTHWAKLEDRIARGVGNPCPLLLVGLPDTIVTFHEGEAALAEVEAADAGDEASAPSA